MAEVTVRQLADVVGIPVDRLLAQLERAGLTTKSADELISDAEKLQLLQHLRTGAAPSNEPRSSNGAAVGKKITLRRKIVSELRQPGGGAKSKTVNVEVRKRRTYVKRSVAVAEESARREQELAEIAAAEEEVKSAASKAVTAEAAPTDQIHQPGVEEPVSAAGVTPQEEAALDTAEAEPVAPSAEEAALPGGQPAQAPAPPATTKPETEVPAAEAAVAAVPAGEEAAKRDASPSSS